MLKDLSSRRVRQWTALGVSLLLIFLAVGAVKALPSAAARQLAAPAGTKTGTVLGNANGFTLAQDAQHDTSPALRSMPLIAPIPRAENGDKDAFQAIERLGGVPGKDSVLQNFFGKLGGIPGPTVHFDGMYNQWGPIPPDTNGDVGPNHYYQIVNTGIQIFNKTGTSLYGPADISTLWQGFGGPCASRNDGDPILLYDTQADRWFVSQFTTAAPFGECIAISASGDPLGSYHRYFFSLSQTDLYDYPHCGVWPDAYYCAFNVFLNGASFGGASVTAFNRDQMLNGQSTTFLASPPIPSAASFMPADVDGHTLPPTGEPNIFTTISTGAQALQFFNFHVDWANPGSSTFSAGGSVPVAAFANPSGVPQPSTSVQLATLAGRLMFRGAYRNFGDHQALVLNHTVTGSGGAAAAPRWYEIRSANSSPFSATLYQQGTYNPDSTSRWMGSAAMDHQGNLALGYSASSSSLYPSIRYTGRLVSDPLNTLPQGEGTFITGSGSQTNSAGRWGDYSDLTVDPVDDCTFWYTTEYLSATGDRNWRTHIGAFKFPACVAVVVTPTSTPSGPTATATSTPVATGTPCGGNYVINVTSSITNTDPTQTGRLAVNGVQSSCGAPKPFPGVNDSEPRHYKSYSYTNSTGAAQCISVRLTNACGNNALMTEAYIGSFNPADISQNYVADMGNGDIVESYSFNLPAGQTAVIVVNERSANIGCDSFTLTANACAAVPTFTVTPTSTPAPPTATPTTVCTGLTYQTTTSTAATQIPATNDIGSHCDDCNTTVTLPFPVQVYGTPYTSARVSANGNLQFASDAGSAGVSGEFCLPVLDSPPFLSTLFGYFQDLRTDVNGVQPSGVYSSVVGTAPNRQYALRWHATYFGNASQEVDFEVIMNENSPTISVIYGQVPANANDAGAGIQLNDGQYTQVSCSGNPPLTAGLRVDYVPVSCNAPTATVTPQNTPTVTQTSVPLVTQTSVPGTATATATPVNCPLPFTDVDQFNPFYQYIQCLYCRGIISGYSDNTFRWGNDVTRGQVSKIIANSAGLNDTVTGQTFTDVDPANPFYVFIERLYRHGYISGYDTAANCPSGIPCFRWELPVTRGQLAKIDANAAGYNETPTGQTFRDVPAANPFYVFIERLSLHGVISGYDCGGPGEPCPGLYYRPFNNITRGQVSKVASQTFFPNSCAPAATRP
jgi:hypothetical protein